MFICEEDMNAERRGQGQTYNHHQRGNGTNNSSSSHGGYGHNNTSSSSQQPFVNGRGGVWTRDTSRQSSVDEESRRKKRILHFWAFSPGIAMEDLKSLGVRSIILTSGTLSPMASFKEDMKLPFPIQLENKHVIDNKRQIWVGSLTTGINGTRLNSTFECREKVEYKDEMGQSILGIVKTLAGYGEKGSIGMGLPPGAELKGGILVFFPSYGIMESCVTRWNESGLMSKLRDIGGAVVVEPKGSDNSGKSGERASFSNGMSVNAVQRNDRWSDRPTAPTTGNNDHKISFVGASSHTTKSAKHLDDDEGNRTDDLAVLGGIVRDFETTLKSRGRCILMAVCRGKVAEGIDFRDEKGRVVIVTGIPFAPFMDPWVVLKRQYLDQRVLAATARNKPVDTVVNHSLSSSKGYVGGTAYPAYPGGYPSYAASTTMTSSVYPSYPPPQPQTQPQSQPQPPVKSNSFNSNSHNTSVTGGSSVNAVVSTYPPPASYPPPPPSTTSALVKTTAIYPPSSTYPPPSAYTYPPPSSHPPQSTNINKNNGSSSSSSSSSSSGGGGGYNATSYVKKEGGGATVSGYGYGQHTLGGGGGTGTTAAASMLTGDSWYNQSASRAVNQVRPFDS